MKILLVEDNIELIKQLKDTLSKTEFTVDVAYDGIEAEFLGKEFNYSLIVLDLGLPKMDGLSVLKSWRSAKMTSPVIVLTARDEWHEKVHAIDAGADDYVTKPFHMQELLSRMRAIIRRVNGHSQSLITIGPLCLDLSSQIIYLQEMPLSLTHHEYKLLAYFMHHPNQILSKSALTEQLYEQDFDRDSNTIEVFIARLRKKLPKEMILTVRGTGYQLIDLVNNASR
ncbi:response regulator transcription factor [Thorsellia kenyensis]|uniref:Response regulator transcription factor n=1 Tax=Thorsellia kenyensis TaxID=1549888 RepID=A0ABV6CE48_9GAMM